MRILTIISILTCSILSAQQYGQSGTRSFEKAKLIMRSGDTIAGLVRLTYQDGVVFKENKKSKKERLGAKEVKLVEFFENDFNLKYEYKLVKGTTQYWTKLLQISEEGNVNLYVEIDTSTNQIGMSNGTKRRYYVSESGNDIAFPLGIDNIINKNFKEFSKDFFKNCPSLIQKIESESFGKRGINEVVQYFNNNCSK